MRRSTGDAGLYQSLKFRAANLPKGVGTILLVSLIIKLGLSALLPLSSDEAYYWVWSHHMQLSFFDHPPAVAWLFWLTHPLENIGGAVRWGGVVLSQLTLFIWLLLLREILDESEIRIWLWLALLSPLLGAGGLLITPDIPMLFCWALTLLLFSEWTKKPSAQLSLLLGLACGLGFSSKYVMILEPMFLTFFALSKKELRKPALVYAPYILLGVAVGSAPVWIWNFQNNFESFRFQANHGLGRKYYKPSWTYEYVLAQIGLIFPTILFWAIKGSRRAPGWLVLLAWGPILFFGLTSFKGYVEANWPIVAYAQIFALAAFGLRRANKTYLATVGLWSVVLSLMFFLIISRWSPFKEPIKTKEFFEFESVVPVAATHSPLYARSYQMASQLSFSLKKPISKLRDMNRRDFFDFLPESLPKEPRFYLLTEPQDRLPDAVLAEGFKVLSRRPIEQSRFEIWEVGR